MNSPLDVAILAPSKMIPLKTKMKTELITDSKSILLALEFSPEYYHSFAKATNTVEPPNINKVEKGRRYIVNAINKRQQARDNGVPFLESRGCQNQERLKFHIRAVLAAKGTEGCVRVIDIVGKEIAMDERCTIPADQPPTTHPKGNHILDWQKEELTIAN